MAHTQNIKTIFMEEKIVRSSEYLTQSCDGLSLSLSPLVTDPDASRPPGERECGGLSLSPLATDPAASRPSGERECVGLSLSHRWSLIRPHPVRRGKGSAVGSLSLTVGH